MMELFNTMPDLPLFSSPVAKATVSSLQHASQSQLQHNQNRNIRNNNNFNQQTQNEVSQLRSQLKTASAELDRYKQLFSQLQSNGGHSIGQNLFQHNFSAMNLSTITGNNSNHQKQKKAKKSKKTNQQTQHHEDCPCCGAVNKPYQCDWPNCFKRFRQRPHLQAHQNIHTGVRFVCEYPGCGKSFVRKYNLQEHGKMHSNRNPNVCPFPDCNKFFSSKYSLTRHQAAQHQV